MMRPSSALRVLMTTLCVLAATACGTDGAADQATEVVTERVVVTEQQTVVETPPPDGDGTDDDGDDVAGDTPDGDGPDDDGGQPFPADTARDRGQAGGEPLTLTDVRVGSHDGYDRVTFEYAGEGRPGWIVEYTDDPRAQGSGAPVEVDGDAVLGVSMRPVAPPTRPDAYDGPERIAAPRLEVIEEVVLGTTFEADLGAFIGVDEEVPFRVRRFEDPSRVVVDVVHTDRVD